MAKKILIADDNTFIRTLVKAALKPLGCEMIEAVDGEEAVRAAEEHDPDLILLDVVMPKMNGFEALEAIRAQRPASHLPIVMLTTAATEADVRRGRDAGANDHIVKPFEKTALRDTVAGLLKM
ncbi:MAG: response regulator [Coriobacteriia bacterium]|nr:response regulator [Coriobacteriia bacterium]